MNKLTKVREDLEKDLNELNLKLEIIPTYRFGNGLLSVIEIGSENSEHNDIDLLKFIGNVSDEPDQHLLEIFLSNESFEFWFPIFGEVLINNETALSNLKNSLEKAKKLGYFYVRLT